ncbi:MAG TPA: glycosyltransferase family 4 protein [Bacteroidia bacterium]|jgi:glycosyltransferase involved in cell wall biosynthesis|nr:glycosyltransferase family 4 protein [Bacteroidia bacterium]
MLQKKVAYITVSDPNDKHAWSGTNHYIWKSLQSHFSQIDLLGPDEPKFTVFICKVIHAFSLLVGKRFDYRHSTMYAKACAKLFSKKLEGKNYDLIVSPAGVAYIGFLKTKMPKVLVLDRTIAGTINYHNIFKKLWKFSEEQSINTDKTAMHNCELTIFSSQWAADIAIKEYKLPQSKALVLPFGANMDNLPNAEFVFANKNPGACNLLLVGTYWENKGVDIAINAMNDLVIMGFDARLTVCGCTPPYEIVNDRVIIIPFINKNSSEGRKKLEELFLSHTFFILPTRFDCTPIVYCEASAYALPVLSSNTGGVAGHITENKNGFLIDYNDMGKAYAQKISEILNEKGRYELLCRTTREEYDKRLNWVSWSENFTNAVRNIIG